MCDLGCIIIFADCFEVCESLLDDTTFVSLQLVTFTTTPFLVDTSPQFI